MYASSHSRHRRKKRSFKWLYSLIIIILLAWLIFDQPPEDYTTSKQEIPIELPPR